MKNYLDKLHELAYSLYLNGMRQSAGDIDYLVSWLKSPEINNGNHLKPNPAGKNTIDAHSNNCPIPYYVCNRLVNFCKSSLYAEIIFAEIKDILILLKEIYTDDVETVALDSYIEYSDEVIALIKGRSPKMIAYTDKSSVLSGESVLLVDDYNEVLQYDYEISYTGMKYFSSEYDITGVDIDNKSSGIYIGRDSNYNLRLYNNTDSTIQVYCVEIKISTSVVNLDDYDYLMDWDRIPVDL